MSYIISQYIHIFLHLLFFQDIFNNHYKIKKLITKIDKLITEINISQYLHMYTHKIVFIIFVDNVKK